MDSCSVCPLQNYRITDEQGTVISNAIDSSFNALISTIAPSKQTYSLTGIFPQSLMPECNQIILEKSI